MATDLIQQSDVDEQKKQQQLQQNPNKFNQFGGLARSFAQNQSAVSAPTIPGAGKLNAQQGVTNAQNAQNQSAVNKGSQVKSNTSNALNAYVVNPSPNVDTLYNSNTNRAAGVGQSPGEAEAARTAAINGVAADQTKALQDWQTNEANKYGDIANNVNSDLTTAAQQNNLTDLGTQNQVQQQAANTNNLLAQQGPALGAGKLAALFGPGYNSERYGAQDSQIYEKQLQDAQRNAQQQLQNSDIAQQGKSGAQQQYNQNVKEAQQSVGDLGQKYKDYISGVLADKTKTIAANKVSAEKTNKELMDKDTQKQKDTASKQETARLQAELDKEKAAKSATAQSQIAADRAALEAQKSAQAAELKKVQSGSLGLKLTPQQEQIQATAEAQRRAAMTPQQRALEDRQQASRASLTSTRGR